MPLNLHHIVRGAIRALKPDTRVTLYRSAGYQTDASGYQTRFYLAGVECDAHFQSESGNQLALENNFTEITTTRKVWLYATGDPATRPWSLWRPLARSGDYLVDPNGQYWFVSAVLEDFSDSGWVSVRATLEPDPPEIVTKPETDGGGQEAGSNE
nr:MAG TPA: head closure knob [Caudoviricetes sp.]